MHNTRKKVQTILENNKDISTVSFDVFDTVLTRLVAEPSSSFFMLSSRLSGKELLKGGPERFVNARISAEYRARRYAINKEITISNIYEELLDEFPTWQASLNDLVEEEVDVERRMLVPVPGVEEIISLVREMGRKVVFVSDMYLPSLFIEERLLYFNLAKKGGEVYVSSEYGVKKAHKNSLFSVMSSNEKIEPSGLLHIGDNPIADHRAALDHGARSILLKETGLTDYEKVLESSRWESSGLTSHLAGVSRLTRLTHAGQQSPEAYVQVLSGVAAPLLVGFTAWLLRSAQDMGLKRLYFLSREGDVLLELARVLARRLGLEIELACLYVSRSSVNTALLTNPDRLNLVWALTHTGSLSLRAILNRIGLQPEEIHEQLTKAGFVKSGWTSRLTDSEFHHLIDLLSTASIQGVIARKAEKSGNVAVRYLETAGLFQDTSIGLVDTAGTGSQMRALHILRSRYTTHDCVGFLIRRMWRDHLQDAGFPQINTYLSDHLKGTGIQAMDGMNHMLEVFSVADYGTVLGYEEQPGGVVPIFEERPLPAETLWHSRTMRAPLLTFAENVMLDHVMCANWKLARGGIMNSFWQFWHHPSREEANVWGGFPVEVGFGKEFRFSELAPVLPFRKFMAVRSGKRVPGVIVNPWYAGLEKRARWHVRALALAYRGIRRSVRRARSFIH